MKPRLRGRGTPGRSICGDASITRDAVSVRFLPGASVIASILLAYRRFQHRAASCSVRANHRKGAMSFSSIFARAVALIGAGAIFFRHRGQGKLDPAYGSDPKIPLAKPQGIPTLKMPTAKGWTAGQTPVAAPGLKVNAFAAGLKHPRWIHVLPNGDVLTAEALSEPGGIKSVFDYAMVSTMRRAAAVGISPNRITLLRDADGDGVAETREVFHGRAEPAVRHGTARRYVLRRQHRWRRRLPLQTRRHPHRRAGTQAGRRSSPAGTGRAAFCRAPMGASFMPASVR